MIKWHQVGDVLKGQFIQAMQVQWLLITSTTIEVMISSGLIGPNNI